MPRLLACLTLALALAPRTAAAQWASIGDMPRPTTPGSSVTFKNAQGVVAVTAVAPDIIRVRFAPGAALGRDHSYAVVGHDLGPANARIQVGADKTTLSTSRLVVTMTHRPFRISIADTRRTVARRRRSAARHRLLRLRDARLEAAADDEQVYGLGEKNGHLNKRGRQLGGYNVTMWNSDTFAYEARHRSDLRCRAVLSRAEAWPRARRLPRQHVPQQLRRRPHDCRGCWRSAPTAAS